MVFFCFFVLFYFLFFVFFFQCDSSFEGISWNINAKNPHRLRKECAYCLSTGKTWSWLCISSVIVQSCYKANIFAKLKIKTSCMKHLLRDGLREDITFQISSVPGPFPRRDTLKPPICDNNLAKGCEVLHTFVHNNTVDIRNYSFHMILHIIV